MEKLTQKWTLVSLLEKHDQGYEFSAADWPLHISTGGTLFEVDWSLGDLLTKLTNLISGQASFDALVLDDTNLGPPDKPVLVTMIDSQTGLGALHEKIVDLLLENGAVFSHPLHIRDGFKAHCTVQKNARLHKGETISIDNLALIDMFPDGDGYQRKILKIIALHK